MNAPTCRSCGRSITWAHCIHGHEFTPENTLITKKGRRSCRTCQRNWWRDHHGEAVCYRGD